MQPREGSGHAACPRETPAAVSWALPPSGAGGLSAFPH